MTFANVLSSPIRLGLRDQEVCDTPSKPPYIADAPRHTAPSLHIYLFHGQGAKIDHEDLAKHDVVITSYQTVFSDSIRSKTLLSIPWFRDVIDEGKALHLGVITIIGTDLSIC